MREPQLGVDARRAVDTLVGRVDLLDLLDQPRVRKRPIRRDPGRPAMAPRAADAEQLALAGDREAGPLRRDDPVDAYRVSLSRAKKAAARLRISRCCSSRLTFLCSSRNSSRSSELSPPLANVDLELLVPQPQRLDRDPELCCDRLQLLPPTDEGAAPTAPSVGC